MADNTVKITFQAVVTQAVGQIDKLKGGLEKLNKSGIGQAVQGLTGFNLTSLGTAGAVVAVGNAVKKAVTEWSSYAEQMDKSAKLSGVSVEEMSRLTQAADDFRVSQDSLKTAMGMALKNGFTPTIENLAKLSDEFIAIKDPADRAALASKIFGRGWQEIAPLLLKGGDAIRAGTAAIEDNLVVTDAAVKQNNEYIKAMDDLDDAMTGFNNQMAKGVIPSWTKFVELLTSPNASSAAELVDAIFRGTALESNVLAAQRAAVSLAEGIAADTNELIKLAAAADKAAPPMDFLANATNNADLAMQKYTKSLLFKIASQNLDEASALALAQRMGLVDEKTVEATKKVAEYKKQMDAGIISVGEYNILVAGLADSYDRLQDKTITLTFNQVTTGTAPNGYWQGTGEGGTVGMRASGGPVMAGNPYLWNESAVTRPEVMVPSQNGYVLTKQDAQAALAGAAGGKGGNTYNIHWNGDYRLLAAELDRQAQLRRLMA